MSLSKLSATKPARASVKAQPVSGWIERFALPLAVSVMEAQPIGLLLALGTFIVTRTTSASPLGVWSIALLALSLLWWAMLIEHSSLTEQLNKTRQRSAFHVLGWLMALAIIVGPESTQLLQGRGILVALLKASLVTWLWRRGITRAHSGTEHAQLTRSFKVAFGVLLFIALVAQLLPQGQMLLTLLMGDLPTFFLSGLVALSLARLGTIRTARRSLDGSQADPTRIWLLALTLLGSGILMLVLLLEVIFSLTTVEQAIAVLTPVWDALGTLTSWILYALIIVVLTPVFDFFSFLLGLLLHGNSATTQQQRTMPTPPRSLLPQSPHAISPEILTLGRWVFLALACLLLLLVVRASLRRWYMLSKKEEIEEVREGLDSRSLLKQRWQEWWSRRWHANSDQAALEPLDPNSARALYRELLQALVRVRHPLVRLPTETPLEYEARLFPYLENGESSTLEPEKTDGVLLDELTQAYMLERYAGLSTDEGKRAALRIGVIRLVKQLMRGRGMSSEQRR